MFGTYKIEIRDLDAEVKIRIQTIQCTTYSTVTATVDKAKNDSGQVFELHEGIRVDNLEVFLFNLSCSLDSMLVYGSDNDGKTWTMLGPATYQRQMQQAEYRTASEARVRFSYITAWPIAAVDAENIILASVALVLAACFRLRRLGLAKRLSAAAAAILCCGWLVAAAVCGLAGPSQSLAFCCWRGAAWLALARAARRAEARLPLVLLGAGASGLVVNAIGGCSPSDAGSGVVGPPFPVCLVLALAGLGLMAAGAAQRAGAAIGAERDAAAYEAHWLRAIRRPSFGREAALLDRVAQRIAADCPARDSEVRHYNRRTNAADGNLLTGSEPGTADTARPVRSLDQLYAQATGLVPVLQGKLAEWSAGLQCAVEDHTRPLPGAWLPQRPRASGMEQCAGLGLVKSPGRAMEKAALCYGGDVSRVVDVCRARVAFGGPADAARFLEAVARDARVLRIKNGMRAGGGMSGYKVMPLVMGDARPPAVLWGGCFHGGVISMTPPA